MSVLQNRKRYIIIHISDVQINQLMHFILAHMLQYTYWAIVVSGLITCKYFAVNIMWRALAHEKELKLQNQLTYLTGFYVGVTAPRVRGLARSHHTSQRTNLHTSVPGNFHEYTLSNVRAPRLTNTASQIRQ